MSIKLKVFYPDGDPYGEVTVEGGASIAVAFPRKKCDDIRMYHSPVCKYPGVYVLWSPRTAHEQARIYVGKSSTPFSRVVRWDKRPPEGFEDWARAVVYTDNRGELAISQIEAKLIRCARDEKLCEVVNKNNPDSPPQNRADAAATKKDIELLRGFFLPLAGCDYFLPRTAGQKPPKSARTAKPALATNAAIPQGDGLLCLSASRRGIEAWGRETDRGFWVNAGSQATKKVSQHFRTPDYERFATERNKLIKRGILESDDGGKVFRFKRGYLFEARSMSGAKHLAATIILGRNANSSNWQPENRKPGKAKKQKA